MTMNHPKWGMPSVLKKRLNEPGILVLPGAFNAITAKLIQSLGFEGVYVTGAGLINGVTGYPDIGLLSMSEITQLAGYIAEAADVPVICDADTGYGEALQVMRTVQQFERAGIAGIHLEDQLSPKRCGHLEGKQLISIEDMQAKIAAAVSARQNPDFLIIARADARSVNGMDDAISRAKAYVEAGAEMIFPEALESKEEFLQFAKAMPHVPLLANMTEFGKSPYLSAQDFEALGYKIVIFPMTAFRVMMKAVETALLTLKQTGTQAGFLDNMQTRQALYQLIDYSSYDRLDKQFLSQRHQQIEV
jgi:methylisocitrate lyase